MTCSMYVSAGIFMMIIFIIFWIILIKNYGFKSGTIFMLEIIGFFIALIFLMYFFFEFLPKIICKLNICC